MILRKLFAPACLVAALAFACGSPSTNTAEEASVGFDANAKPAACCPEKSAECSEAEKAACEAKKAECTEKKVCPETGETVQG